MSAADRPGSYSLTQPSDARDFLDEGSGALDPGISTFLCNYWNTLSYGNLALMLTLLGLSTSSETKLKWVHYQRIKQIAFVDMVTFIAPVLFTYC